MARFIAIPVAQGDAFYLERDGFSALVDGGRSRSAFPAMFRGVTQSGGVDVLVCTHNDADHANGILGFLESGLRCKEVWLPGRWLSALPGLLRPFVEVVEDLSTSILKLGHPSKASESDSGLSALEAYAEYLGEGGEDSREDELGLPVERNGWPAQYVQMLRSADRLEVPSFINADRPFGPYGRYRSSGGWQTELLWSAIDAAHRIRAIAIEAFRRGMCVRWFEYGPAMPAGGVVALCPINARAVVSARPQVLSLFCQLALTVANKESLVFWSPSTDQHPGVLFTADSDLATAGLPSDLKGALVTAPHHGSEANARAYSRVADAAGDEYSSVTWIRSDGRYNNRPGRTYLAIPGPRLCTLCRCGAGQSAPKQAVRFFSGQVVWVRDSASVLCVCQ